MKINLETLLREKRFQAPEGWDWSFRTFDDGSQNKMKIRYGQVRSRASYKAVAVIIGGLGDFGEQYFELANQLIAEGIKPIIIDMPGQGGSSRYLPEQPMRRHSKGFDVILSQLHSIFDENVVSSAIDINDNHKRLPCILIAHSMAGHIALRYLAEYNKSSRGLDIFTCATLTSPMLGIQAVRQFPAFLRFPIIKLLSLRPSAYVPGGCDWYDGYRERLGFEGIFSSDPVRYEIQRAYYNDPAHQFLVTGSPTNKWLLDAYLSCKKIEEKGYLEKIHTPVLIGIAGADRLVDNTATHAALKRLKHAEYIEFADCQHEIFMESDKFRTPFIERFFTFIKDNVLNRIDAGKTYIQ